LLQRFQEIYQIVQRANLDISNDVLLPMSEDVVRTDRNVQVVFQNQNLEEINLTRKNNSLPPVTFLHLDCGQIIKTLVPPSGKKIPQYAVGALGGTFDRIHAGHKLLLNAAVLSITRKLFIGLADGPLLEKKSYKEILEPFEIRKQNLFRFLIRLNPHLEYCIVPLVDVGGPAVSEEDVNAIIVSIETMKGAEWINQERAKRNFKPLEIVKIDLVENHPELGVDKDNKISSTQLRKRAWEKQHKTKL